jgi:glycosyltransferase involved in cell wall biosynthesis
MGLDSPTDNVKVTVGICVKNSETTVKEAIESLLAQDFPHVLMELIVVDGCSRDKTLSIIEQSIKEANITTKIFCENEGLGRARQVVVDNANGEYVIWLDGDMILSKDFVRKQVEFMDHNPDVGIAKGKYGVRKDCKNEKLVAKLENIEFLLNTMFEGETNLRALGSSGCVYRVSAIRQVGGFDNSISGVGEDMDIEYRVRTAGWRLYITSALFYETRRQTWRSLWEEYFWHGKGGETLFEKNRQHINLYKMLPPIALLAEVSRVPMAYRLTREKRVLFLPFHYTFKRIAWFLGFLARTFERRGGNKAV